MSFCQIIYLYYHTLNAAYTQVETTQNLPRLNQVCSIALIEARKDGLISLQRKHDMVTCNPDGVYTKRAHQSYIYDDFA